MALSKVDPNFLNVSQVGGRRNLIINGAMQVAQRGTSFTGLSDTNTQYTLDRWEFGENGSIAGTLSFTQSSDAPSGFGSSVKIACTATGGASSSSNEYMAIRQSIEAQNCQQLKFGSADVEQFTVSFWAKAVNYSDPISVALFVPDVLGYASASVTPTSSWTRHTVTFTGYSGASINNDNGQGIRLSFVLSGTSSGTFARAEDTDVSTTRIDYVNDIGNFLDSVSNELYITGVQLEVGDTATPFEHRSFGEELALCQRYYYQAGSGCGWGSAESGSGTAAFLHAVPWRHPVEMRAGPSVSAISGGSTYFAGGAGITIGTPGGDAGTISNSDHTIGYLNTTSSGVNRVSLGNGFSFQRGQSYMTTSNFLEIDAEL